jgi:hypothetical protein
MERRLLFSGDVAPWVLSEPLWSATGPWEGAMSAFTALNVHAAPAQTEHAGAPQVLVVIDGRVAFPDQFVAAIQAQRGPEAVMTVVQLDGAEDGLQRVSAMLDGAHGVFEAVHVVAHGAEGALQMGESLLDSAALRARSAEIAGWSEGLSADADLFLWGCSTGRGVLGRDLVAGLAALTGADVAASDDATGSFGAGGDGVLEVIQGVIGSRENVPEIDVRQYPVLLDATATTPERIADLSVVSSESSVRSSAGRQVAISAAGSAVAWIENDASHHVFMQRYDPSGQALAGPVRVSEEGLHGAVDVSVAMDPAGHVLVVWAFDSSGADSANQLAARWMHAGAGGDVLVSDLDTGRAFSDQLGSPSVTLSADGHHGAVVWVRDHAGDGLFQVYARRFAVEGGLLSWTDAATLPISHEAANHIHPDVAVANDGSILVTYQRDVQGVWLQSVTAAGSVSAPEVVYVDSQGGGLPHRPTLAVSADGAKAVVAWVGRLTFPTETGAATVDQAILARSLDRDAQQWGAVHVVDRVPIQTLSGPILVPPGLPDRPSIAGVPQGGFVVAWEAANRVGAAGLEIRSRMLDGQGVPDGAAWTVNENAANDHRAPSVAASGIDFSVAWLTRSDLDSTAIVVRDFLAQPGLKMTQFGQEIDAVGLRVGRIEVALADSTVVTHPVLVRLSVDQNSGARLRVGSPLEIEQTSVALTFLTSGVVQNVWVTGDAAVITTPASFQVQVTTESADERYADRTLMPFEFVRAESGASGLVLSEAQIHPQSAAEIQSHGVALDVAGHMTARAGDLVRVDVYAGSGFLGSKTFDRLTESGTYPFRWTLEGLPETLQSGVSIHAHAVVLSMAGFRGAYVDDTVPSQGVPRWVRHDSLNDWDGSAESLVGGLAPDGYAVRWEGGLTAPESGDYRFRSAADDGLRLWIVPDSSDFASVQPVIDRWFDQSPQDQVSDSVALVAGQSYRVRVDYYAHQAASGVQLAWQPPGSVDFSEIPVFSTPISDGGASLRSANVLATGRSAPVMTLPAEIEFKENHPRTNFARVTINDAEGTDDAVFAIVGGADAARFSIDANTGALSWVTQPDFEAPTQANPSTENRYALQVRATDRSGLSTDQTLTVQVMNVNDSAPVITSHGGASHVAVQLHEGMTSVTTVVAFDADSPSLVSGLSYELAGADAARFAMDTQGRLTFLVAPDFEQPEDSGLDSHYDLVVTVSDGLNASQQLFTVEVLAMDESPPLFSGAAFEFEVTENTRDVTLVQATDADVVALAPRTYQPITYALADTLDAGLFEIDAHTGDLRFKAAPDYEAMSPERRVQGFRVQVLATSGELSAMREITIRVGAQNDHDPVITSPLELSVDEGRSAVVTLTADDLDVISTSGVKQSVSFEIVSDVGQSSAFRIRSGRLEFVEPPDFESEAAQLSANRYEVGIRASDGTRAVTKVVRLTVRDVNEFFTIVASSAVYDTYQKITRTVPANAFAVADPDLNQQLWMQVEGVNGRVEMASLSGLNSVTRNGSVGYEGSVAAMTTALGGLRFVPDPSYVGRDAKIVLTVLDPTPSALSSNPVSVEIRFNVMLQPKSEGGGAQGVNTPQSRALTRLAGAADSRAAADGSGGSLSSESGAPSIRSGGSAAGAGLSGMVAGDASGDAQSSGAPNQAVGAGLSNLEARLGGGAVAPALLSPTVRVPGESVNNGRGALTPNARIDEETLVSEGSENLRKLVVGANEAFSGAEQGSNIEGAATLGEAVVPTRLSDTDDRLPPSVVLARQEFIQALNELRAQASGTTVIGRVWSGSSVAASAALTIAYAMWLLRGGVLLASTLASIPTWRSIDPMPVLDHYGPPEGRSDAEDESLRGLLQKAAVTASEPGCVLGERSS